MSNKHTMLALLLLFSVGVRARRRGVPSPSAPPVTAATFKVTARLQRHVAFVFPLKWAPALARIHKEARLQEKDTLLAICAQCVNTFAARVLLDPARAPSAHDPGLRKAARAALLCAAFGQPGFSAVSGGPTGAAFDGSLALKRDDVLWGTPSDDGVDAFLAKVLLEGDVADVEVVSFCSPGSKTRIMTRIHNFVDCTKAWNLAFTPVSGRVNGTWQGWGLMQHVYADYAATLPPRQLVTMVDTADALPQAGPAAVAAAFHRVSGGRPLVIGLETNCPEGFCVPVPHIVARAGPSPSGIPSLQNVNGGFVIGEAWAVHKLWRAVARNENNVSCCRRGKLHPQLGIGRFALRNPNLVAYDERQELVGNVVNVNSDEWHAHWELVTAEPPVKDKDTPLAAMPEREAKHQVHNKYTRVRPCFLHIPGLIGKQRALAVAAYTEVVAGIVPSKS